MGDDGDVGADQWKKAKRKTTYTLQSNRGQTLIAN